MQIPGKNKYATLNVHATYYVFYKIKKEIRLSYYRSKSFVWIQTEFAFFEVQVASSPRDRARPPKETRTTSTHHINSLAYLDRYPDDGILIERIERIERERFR